jgi:hypothetical protein
MALHHEVERPSCSRLPDVLSASAYRGQPRLDVLCPVEVTGLSRLSRTSLAVFC